MVSIAEINSIKIFILLKHIFTLDLENLVTNIMLDKDRV
jgi:hypothetical protein